MRGWGKNKNKKTTMQINQPLQIISDEQRAIRYRRKLEDLLQATSELLFVLPIPQLTPTQQSLALALEDEANLIQQQLDNEKDFREKKI